MRWLQWTGQKLPSQRWWTKMPGTFCSTFLNSILQTDCTHGEDGESRFHLASVPKTHSFRRSRAGVADHHSPENVKSCVPNCHAAKQKPSPFAKANRPTCADLAQALFQRSRLFFCRRNSVNRGTWSASRQTGCHGSGPVGVHWLRHSSQPIFSFAAKTRVEARSPSTCSAASTEPKGPKSSCPS